VRGASLHQQGFLKPIKHSKCCKEKGYIGEFISFKNKSASFQEKNVPLYKSNLHEKNLFIIFYLIDIYEFIYAGTNQAV